MYRSRRTLWVAACVVLVAVVLAPPAGRGQTPSDVDIALVLAVDCSYSVDASEFRLQMDGLAAAFQSEEVIAAIRSGPLGRVAVTVFQWAGPGSQAVVVPWTTLESRADALRLAGELARAPRLSAESATSITSAINAGVVLHIKSPFKAARRVIDISSDGYNNTGAKPDPARDRAIGVGLTINGLAILNEIWYLDKYFENHVTGGPGNFVIVAEDYAAYREAIRRKLIQEIVAPTA